MARSERRPRLHRLSEDDRAQRRHSVPLSTPVWSERGQHQGWSDPSVQYTPRPGRRNRSELRRRDRDELCPVSRRRTPCGAPEDKALGYPALETILGKQPEFFIATGDNVYYDVPFEQFARTQAFMRKKWHEQLVQQRFIDLFAEVPTYWEKDDHDYRYNDTDNTVETEPDPSPALGAATFLEQVPVVDPNEPNPVTYRTHRVFRNLQIWLTEGRDYRSPTMMPAGPDKTLWGAEQLAWVKRTLLESDATFKILISPTPMIGPDDANQAGRQAEGHDPFKRDNHSNPQGFQFERDAFFDWLEENDLLGNHFYIVSGDRHWQYHSIHPRGFEEFSTGSAVTPATPNRTTLTRSSNSRSHHPNRPAAFSRSLLHPETSQRPPSAGSTNMAS